MLRKSALSAQPMPDRATVRRTARAASPTQRAAGAIAPMAVRLAELSEEVALALLGGRLARFMKDLGGAATHHLPSLAVGGCAAARAASSLLRHDAASASLPWASCNFTRRSSASGMRTLPDGGIADSRSFMP